MRVNTAREILTYHQVVGLLRSGDRVTGVRVYDHQNQRRYELHAPVVVNAAGIWGQQIAEYADLRIRMFPAKGAADPRPPHQQHGDQPLPQTGRRRHPGAG